MTAVRAFKTFLILCSGWALVTLSPLQGQKFLEDDPLWQDPDRLLIPPPERIEFSRLADWLKYTYMYRPEGAIPVAENVNTLGEVPDSSWFTNRMGSRVMSPAELVRGPNQLDGPDLHPPWEVLGMKSEGLTPGMRVRDGRGDVYFVKFDPFKHPQLTTSSEVIATKFFHAFGYHVPENYLVYIRPDELKIAATATIEEHDDPRPLTRTDLSYVLDRLPRRPDGTIQVMASRTLPGQALGPFSYFGTRSDDPNDIFPHENRRELRGLRLFSAWLNHDDARSLNTMNVYLPQGERGYIRHYLIDFGSCLGSASTGTQNPRAGNEYILEWDPTKKAGLTLGIWDRPWRKVSYPDYPSVGNFEADFFHPPAWRPEYPNPAFERMLMGDAFWAAKIIQRFTDDMVRALVRTGALDDQRAERYLIETLIRRRDKIVRYYVSRINPLDQFRVSGDGRVLEFENVALLAGLLIDVSYQYQWYQFDNATSASRALDAAGSTSGETIPIPEDPSAYLRVQIAPAGPGKPGEGDTVDVYIRNGSPKSVVGIERQGAERKGE